MELVKSFETEVIEASGDKPVLVDFWAPWCGPCQVLGPVLEEVAKERSDELELVKVNIDEHQNLATQYGVRGIPHVILFHNGKAIESFSGARSKPQVNDWLDEHIPTHEKEEWEALKEAWNEVPNEQAIPPLKDFSSNYPEHEEAKVLLARHLAFFNIEEANELVEDIKMESPHYDIARYIQFLAEHKDHEVYRQFIENYIENDLLFAFEKLNDTLLKSAGEEITFLEKLGVALYSINAGKEYDIIKARKVFDMYTT